MLVVEKPIYMGAHLPNLWRFSISAPLRLCVKKIIALISNTTGNICRDVTVIKISEKSVNLPFKIKDYSINLLVSEGGIYESSHYSWYCR